MSIFEDNLGIIEKIVDEMYSDYMDSNCEGYDVVASLEKNYLEQFIIEINENGTCDDQKRKDYYAIFQSLQDRYLNYYEKEAVEFFLNYLSLE